MSVEYVIIPTNPEEAQRLMEAVSLSQEISSMFMSHILSSTNLPAELVKGL